jgi:hypothetical protein
MRGLAFTVTLALMLLGFYLMALAFTTPDLEFLLFGGGLLAACLAFFIPLQLAKD